jgi:flagellum-specific ATP synthase
MTASAPTIFDRLAAEVPPLLAERIAGRIDSVRGLAASATGLPAPVGAACTLRSRCGDVVDAEVVGLRDGAAVLSILGESAGLAPGDPVVCRPGVQRVPVGPALLGRVINGRGEPIDGRPAPRLNRRYPITADPPSPVARPTIDTPLSLGVRSIDALLTAGRGQRLGIFAGTGVGKSVLMGMICRHTAADVNVIALVGERGREVREFLDRDLGPEALLRSIVVVCTSDEPAATRVRCCLHATAIAEYFRDQGRDVLLMMDSITRVAMAQRQLGLAAGEPPTAKGYPPSVFALLPRLLERAGRAATGSITGIYTVLVEGDDIDEPLADAVRGILDGHIWLSRKLANRGHFPAIDVLGSISRVADSVVSEAHHDAALNVRRVLATWNDIEDLVSIGAYVPGANSAYDVAVQMRDAIHSFLVQDREQRVPFDAAAAALKELNAAIDSAAARLKK